LFLGCQYLVEGSLPAMLSEFFDVGAVIGLPHMKARTEVQGRVARLPVAGVGEARARGVIARLCPV
jgi:hypothetical protein